jgi:hypothetical protein
MERQEIKKIVEKYLKKHTTRNSAYPLKTEGKVGVIDHG